jgi:hypothetical protein
MTTTPEAKIEPDHALESNGKEEKNVTGTAKKCGPALCPRCQQAVME